MTPQEALMYVGRYAPCAHEETTPAGFAQTKCRECGRFWARELPPPLEAHEKFMQALDVLGAAISPQKPGPECVTCGHTPCMCDQQ